MPIDTSKQASMYLKGYVQNIWKRDANGEAVVPYEKNWSTVQSHTDYKLHQGNAR